MPENQKMVLEFRIYPTTNVKEGKTIYSSSVISFDRESLAEDLVKATELGIVCVINTVRHVRVNGFREGPGKPMILPEE